MSYSSSTLPAPVDGTISLSSYVADIRERRRKMGAAGASADDSTRMERDRAAKKMNFSRPAYKSASDLSDFFSKRRLTRKAVLAAPTASVDVYKGKDVVCIKNDCEMGHVWFCITNQPLTPNERYVMDYLTGDGDEYCVRYARLSFFTLIRHHWSFLMDVEEYTEKSIEDLDQQLYATINEFVEDILIKLDEYGEDPDPIRMRDGLTDFAKNGQSWVWFFTEYQVGAVVARPTTLNLEFFNWE